MFNHQNTHIIMQHTLFETVNSISGSEKHWAAEDQPQYKLLEVGTQGMTITELIAVLLSGMPNPSATAKRLLSAADNDLKTLSHFSHSALCKFDGITSKRASAILAALELGRRLEFTTEHRAAIKSSETVYTLFKPLLSDLQFEEFWIITLNRANKVIKRHKISQGGLSGTVIDTRIILKKCLDDLGSSLICVHNHPSGNKQPSDADIKITGKLKQAAETLEIKMLDHVIVAQDTYFSFADEGLI